MLLSAERDWKRHALLNPLGYYDLRTEDLGDVPVRLFLSEQLLDEAEPSLYPQIVNATRFAGARAVVITPDVHFGYGVPVGCVIATDRESGAIALGPVGFDMGCGMISARSDVPSSAATPDRKLEFNRKVMERVNLGTGGTSVRFGRLSPDELMTWLRGGASGYLERFGSKAVMGRTERDRLPIDEDWSPPWGEPGHPERGLDQLGSLGGGNHFIELQRGVASDQNPADARLGTLHVQIHTGSRGFGHGLATNYFALAKAERPEEITHLDLGYFLPDSAHFNGYLNAVSAAANFAILNRLVIFEQVADAFEQVFGEPLELVYGISHNLVQAEEHPEFGSVWVHRKGATRAFPAGHPALDTSPFASTGHPVLIPGSNRDESFILRPEPGSIHSLYSVNHGAGRRLSRGEALRRLDQAKVNETYRRAGVQVNDDGEVPLDESSQCYKRSNDVIEAVTSANLARVETRLWPLASIKGSDTVAGHSKRSRRDKERSRNEERRRSREHKRGRDD
ncbi:MAG: RtcB family protein [Polyangiaceae bacterium]